MKEIDAKRYPPLTAQEMSFVRDDITLGAWMSSEDCKAPRGAGVDYDTWLQRRLIVTVDHLRKAMVEADATCRACHGEESCAVCHITGAALGLDRHGR